MFSARLSSGASRRQGHEGDVGGEIELAGGVPPGLVEDEQRVCAGRDGLAMSSRWAGMASVSACGMLNATPVSRLGKPSQKRVSARELRLMLSLYRDCYRGWNVKHFHEHLVRDHDCQWGYTWVKTQLHAAGLVERAQRRGAHQRKRERKPCEGMMLHQDGSRAAWLIGEPMLDLIVTVDDATSTIYSAFLVEEEGTASTFRGLLEVFTAHGLPSSAALQGYLQGFRSAPTEDR
jgi:hypothetical protein